MRSDVTAPSRFTNLFVSNSTVVSQYCSSSQGLLILKPLRRAVSYQARWMASAETSSAQYDARINQGPADCVVLARLYLYSASPNIFHSGLDCELNFSVRLRRGAQLFKSQEPTTVQAGGELRHDRGVGLKADAAPIGWARAMQCSCNANQRTMTSRSWYSRYQIVHSTGSLSSIMKPSAAALALSALRDS